MWLLSRQLLSPYTATRPPLCSVSPSTACSPPDAAVPKRPAERAVPATKRMHTGEASQRNTINF
jgi:hypothetical protein